MSLEYKFIWDIFSPILKFFVLRRRTHKELLLAQLNTLAEQLLNARIELDPVQLVTTINTITHLQRVYFPSLDLRPFNRAYKRMRTAITAEEQFNTEIERLETRGSKIRAMLMRIEEPTRLRKRTVRSRWLLVYRIEQLIAKLI